MILRTTSLTLSIAAATIIFAQSPVGRGDPQTMDAKTARREALSTRVMGRVGGAFAFRGLKTDQSFNYKLRATWITPDVIKANARLKQLASRSSLQQYEALITEANAVGGTVVLVELDPNEGSGVIPRDWSAALQPRDATTHSAAGIDSPKLESIPALVSADRRDYSYELFYVLFPLKASDGTPLFRPEDREAELVLQIHNQVGRVRWVIPDSIRALAVQ